VVHVVCDGGKEERATERGRIRIEQIIVAETDKRKTEKGCR